MAKRSLLSRCPSYQVIKAAKGESYPSKNKILIQDYLVEVDLQAQMDKNSFKNYYG